MSDDQKALDILAQLSPIERHVWIEMGRRLLSGEDATAVAAWAQAEVARLAALDKAKAPAGPLSSTF